MQSLKSVLIAASLAVAGTTTNAAVLFSDGFEGETLGAIPSQWANGLWPDSGSNEVVNNVAASGSQSLRTTSGQFSQKGVYAPGTLYQGDQTLSFDVYLPSGGINTEKFGGIIYAGNKLWFESDGAGQVYLSHQAYGTGTITNSVLTFSEQSWQSVALDYDWNANLIDISVNNSAYLTVSSSGFDTSGGWASDLSAFGGNRYGPRTVYFDNFSIESTAASVPLPGTLALLSLGLIWLRRRVNG